MTLDKEGMFVEEQFTQNIDKIIATEFREPIFLDEHGRWCYAEEWKIENCQLQVLQHRPLGDGSEEKIEYSLHDVLERKSTEMLMEANANIIVSPDVFNKARIVVLENQLKEAKSELNFVYSQIRKHDRTGVLRALFKRKIK
jgi:hypothetical protein